MPAHHANKSARPPGRLTTTVLPAACGAFLLGLALGCVLPSRGSPDAAVPLFAAIVGGLLLAAFRVYEGRAVEQEARIAALEGGRATLEAANESLERSHESLVRSAASGLGAIPGADDHTSRVAPLAAALGLELGLDEDAVAGLRTAAFLHDLGRLDVPAEVWSRAGALSEEEWVQVRAHPARGARRLASLDFPWPVAAIVRAQQERWDGTGYPDGLFGEAIPLGARILAVADAYNAMRSPRPHRPPMDHAAAMAALDRDSGHRFDPRVVAALTRLTSRGDFLDLVPDPAAPSIGTLLTICLP